MSDMILTVGIDTKAAQGQVKQFKDIIKNEVGAAFAGGEGSARLLAQLRSLDKSIRALQDPLANIKSAYEAIGNAAVNAATKAAKAQREAGDEAVKAATRGARAQEEATSRAAKAQLRLSQKAARESEASQFAFVMKRGAATRLAERTSLKLDNNGQALVNRSLLSYIDTLDKFGRKSVETAREYQKFLNTIQGANLSIASVGTAKAVTAKFVSPAAQMTQAYREAQFGQYGFSTLKDRPGSSSTPPSAVIEASTNTFRQILRERMKSVAEAEAQAILEGNAFTLIRSRPKNQAVKGIGSETDNYVKIADAERGAAGTNARIDRQLTSNPALQARLYADVDAALKQHVGTITQYGAKSDQARRSQADFKSVLSATGSEISKHGGLLKNLNENFGKLAVGTQSLNRFLMNTGVALQALAAAFGLREIVQANITMQQMRLTLDAVSGSAAKGADNMRFAEGVANKYGYSIGEVGKTFARYLASANQAGDTTEQSQKTYENTAAALRVLGKSDAELEGVIRAFEQIKSKGTVMAEELRLQIGDRIPGAVAIMAKAVGVTTQQLTKMMENGEVSSRYLGRFSEELLKSVGGITAAEKAGNTMQAAFGRLSTAALKAAEAFGKGGFNDAVVAATDALTRFLSSAEGMESLRNLGEFVKNWIGPAFVTLAENIDKIAIAMAALAGTAAFNVIINLITEMKDKLEVLWPILKQATLALGGFLAASGALPSIAIGAAVAGVAVAVGYLVDKSLEGERAQLAYNETMAGYARVNEKAAQTNMELAGSMEPVLRAQQASIQASREELEIKERLLQIELAKRLRGGTTTLGMLEQQNGGALANTKEWNDLLVIRQKIADLDAQGSATQRSVNRNDELQRKKGLHETFLQNSELITQAMDRGSLSAEAASTMYDQLRNNLEAGIAPAKELTAALDTLGAATIHTMTNVDNALKVAFPEEMKKAHVEDQIKQIRALYEKSADVKAKVNKFGGINKFEEEMRDSLNRKSNKEEESLQQYFNNQKAGLKQVIDRYSEATLASENYYSSIERRGKKLPKAMASELAALKDLGLALQNIKSQGEQLDGAITSVLGGSVDSDTAALMRLSQATTDYRMEVERLKKALENKNLTADERRFSEEQLKATSGRIERSGSTFTDGLKASTSRSQMDLSYQDREIAVREAALYTPQKAGFMQNQLTYDKEVEGIRLASKEREKALAVRFRQVSEDKRLSAEARDAELRDIEAIADAQAQLDTEKLSRASKRFDMSQAEEESRQFARVFSNSMNVAEDSIMGFLDGTKSAAEAVSDTFKAMASDIIREMIRINVTQPMVKAMSSAGSGLFSSLFSAQGNVFDGGQHLQYFANGGAFTNSVVSSPTAFPLGVMGERGPEAIMPLTRLPGGDLGVQMTGGGGGAPINFAPTINITVEGSGGKGDEESDTKMAERIGKTVRDQIRAEMITVLRQQMRPNGMLNPV